MKRSEVQLCFCLFSFPWSVDLCTFDSTTLHSLGFGFGFFWGVPGESGTGGDFVFISLNQTPDPGSRKKWNLRVTTCLISTERIPTHPSHQFSLSPSSREATWWAYMPNGANSSRLPFTFSLPWIYMESWCFWSAPSTMGPWVSSSNDDWWSSAHQTTLSALLKREYICKPVKVQEYDLWPYNRELLTSACGDGICAFLSITTGLGKHVNNAQVLRKHESIYIHLSICPPSSLEPSFLPPKNHCWIQSFQIMWSYFRVT